MCATQHNDDKANITSDEFDVFDKLEPLVNLDDETVEAAKAALAAERRAAKAAKAAKADEAGAASGSKERKRRRSGDHDRRQSLLSRPAQDAQSMTETLKDLLASHEGATLKNQGRFAVCNIPEQHQSFKPISRRLTLRLAHLLVPCRPPLGARQRGERGFR